MPKDHESELWIDLGNGKALRVRAVTFEDGMPTPGEADLMRKPTGEELVAFTLDSQKLGPVTLKKPF